MDKSASALRLKIANIDLSEWYDQRKKRSDRFGIPLLVSNVDLFMEALNRCKNLDELQAVVDDIKPHKELYEGIYSPLYLRPVPPANVDDAIRDLEFDIKEKRAGKVYYY